MKPLKSGRQKKSLLLFTNFRVNRWFLWYKWRGIKVIKQYIHNPVRSFKPVWKTFTVLLDRDMTFGEYRDGLRLFHDFHATGTWHIFDTNRYFYRPRSRFIISKSN
jgi:hypothetical protein